MTNDTRLDQLFRLGFDHSYRDGRDSGGRFSRSITVRCSQCAAAAICGVPCHETGCPNQTGTCVECGDVVPARVYMCESCANPEPFEESELDQDDDYDQDQDPGDDDDDSDSDQDSL